jgi:hypothetical protein
LIIQADERTAEIQSLRQDWATANGKLLVELNVYKKNSQIKYTLEITYPSKEDRSKIGGRTHNKLLSEYLYRSLLSEIWLFIARKCASAIYKSTCSCLKS